MESVDKALLALDHLSRSMGNGMPLGELAAALGLKKNSLHRTLAALRYRGFIVQDVATGNYQLGPALLRLADNYFSEGRLRQLFHPLLTELCDEVNELCHLGTLDGADVVYLDKVEPLQPIRVWSTIGMRAPAVTTGLGRAMIAFQHDNFESFSKKFNAPIPQRTPHTITDLFDVWHEIRIARMRGYATESQEGQVGVSCVALPILRSGVPVFAVSITAPSERLNRVRIGQLVATARALIGARLPEGLTVPEDESANEQASGTAR